MIMSTSPIIVALDHSSAHEAWALVRQLSPSLCRLKVGLHLYLRAGKTFVAALIVEGFDVFLDLKFHDIPNTVYDACSAAAELGVWMLTVHAQGGLGMLEAARAGVDATSVERHPLLVAVTMLTSLDQQQLTLLGVSEELPHVVNHCARLAVTGKMDGVVCSPNELSMLRTSLPPAFMLVTPGIRPIGCKNNDQSRVATPKQAISEGSDFLVIGRPITQSPDPLAALKTLVDSVS